MSAAWGQPTGMSGLAHWGRRTLGVLGSQIPTTGDSYAALLAGDVVDNGWQAAEVRWRLSSSTFPSLQVFEDSSVLHTPLPDGTYVAAGVVSVDGVDVGTSTLTAIWGSVIAEPQEGARRVVRLQRLLRRITTMSRIVTTLEDMVLGEQDFIEFDYTAELAVGESISAVVVGVDLVKGADNNPASMRDGNPIPSGGIVKQRVLTDNRAGNTYVMRCRATTSASRVLISAGYLRVVKL